MVFISYFTIDAHDTHQLHKLHLMHLLQTTIWTAAVNDHFLQHTSAASPSTYIILSICERYFRSLTFLLRNRSASTKRKISFRHRYELCHYVPLAYWPSSVTYSIHEYISMWLWMIFAWLSYAIQVLRYRVGSYYHPVKMQYAVWQPRWRWVKETTMGGGGGCIDAVIMTTGENNINSVPFICRG